MTTRYREAKADNGWRFIPGRFTPCSTLQAFYNWANKKFFNHELPYVRVGYYRQKKDEDDSYGAALRLWKAKYCHYIIIDSRFTDWNRLNYKTILYEMIHVKFNNKHGHGPKFQKEKQRLIDAGAFTPYL